ncbi:bacterio-opsin activator [halophilic archaeon]|nr:bacterio-opsin activator [halophilic archaeon]
MAFPRSELLSVKLELWHPDCWTVEVMEETGAGVLGHGSVMDGRQAFERCTIYGDSSDSVREAVKTAKDSTRISHVQEVQSTPTESIAPESAIGTFSQDVFIEYEFTEGIGPAFFSRGFMLDGASQMEDRKEIWPLLVRMDRAALGRRIEKIRKEYNANITFKHVTPVDQERSRSSFQNRLDDLTPRQRQSFELARQNGYYEWPRETSVQDLADELGVSKTTFLEHLRSAENCLLDPPETQNTSE